MFVPLFVCPSVFLCFSPKNNNFFCCTVYIRKHFEKQHADEDDEEADEVQRKRIRKEKKRELGVKRERKERRGIKEGVGKKKKQQQQQFGVGKNLKVKLSKSSLGKLEKKITSLKNGHAKPTSSSSLKKGLVGGVKSKSPSKLGKRVVKRTAKGGCLGGHFAYCMNLTRTRFFRF